MTDLDLCAILNKSLPPGWHPFEPLGDEEEVHTFLREAYIGVRGKLSAWLVIQGEDCLPVDREVYLFAESAMLAAERLAVDTEMIGAERLADEEEGRR